MVTRKGEKKEKRRQNPTERERKEREVETGRV